MNDKETFKNIVESYPTSSSYIAFAKLVKGKNFTRQKITRLMSTLVDKGDYLGSEKSALIDNLVNAELSIMDEIQENKKQIDRLDSRLDEKIKSVYLDLVEKIK